MSSPKFIEGMTKSALGTIPRCQVIRQMSEIYSKRYLIKTMQLVGATGGFIRKPFLMNGLKHGNISGIISCLLLWGIIFTATKKIPDLEQVTDLQMMIYLFGIILLTGIIISGISTFFAVRKYLRLSSEELYY